MVNNNDNNDDTPLANVIRDANGRVVSVLVNLPSNVSESYLPAVRETIQNTSGVSQGQIIEETPQKPKPKKKPMPKLVDRFLSLIFGDES